MTAAETVNAAGCRVPVLAMDPDTRCRACEARAAALPQLRSALGSDTRAARCWDSELTETERTVLLRAAGLPAELRATAWRELPEGARGDLFRAAYRASKWARGLGLVTAWEGRP